MIFRRIPFALFVGLVILLWTQSPVFSIEEIVKPVQLAPIENDQIVLTISGTRGIEVFTLAKIESLGLKRMQTTTFWQEDDGVYEGVLLRDLLAFAGGKKCSSILATALDDYQVEIPCIDFDKWPVILATRRDGRVMSIRKKGPTRIIYPKSLGGDLALSTMRSRWIWALKKIEIKN